MASGSSGDRNGGVGRNNCGIAAETEAVAAAMAATAKAMVPPTAMAPPTATALAMATATALAMAATATTSWSGHRHCRRLMHMNVRVSLRRTPVPRGLDSATFCGCWRMLATICGKKSADANASFAGSVIFYQWILIFYLRI